eukprot:scaffold2679_cov251-Pinguiococcus_pyrenoidosus.AAC.13
MGNERRLGQAHGSGDAAGADGKAREDGCAEADVLEGRFARERVAAGEAGEDGKEGDDDGHDAHGDADDEEVVLASLHLLAGDEVGKGPDERELQRAHHVGRNGNARAGPELGASILEEVLELAIGGVVDGVVIAHAVVHGDHPVDHVLSADLSRVEAEAHLAVGAVEHLVGPGQHRRIVIEAQRDEDHLAHDDEGQEVHSPVGDRLEAGVLAHAAAGWGRGFCGPVARLRAPPPAVVFDPSGSGCAAWSTRSDAAVQEALKHRVGAKEHSRWERRTSYVDVEEFDFSVWRNRGFSELRGEIRTEGMRQWCVADL